MMAEVDKQTEGLREKTSKLAVAALVLAVPVFAVSIVMFYNPSSDLPGLIVLCLWALSVASLYLSVISLYQIIQRNDRLRNGILGFMAIGMCFFAFLASVGRPYAYSRYYECVAVQLRSLKAALDSYSTDNYDSYPTPNKWCDLLLGDDSAHAVDYWFVCPAKKGQERCSYALNPNAHPNSPPDMVLLFETQGGWNQFGGPELLNTENHPKRDPFWGYKVSGASVLFNSGSSWFVEQGQFDSLKWKADPNEK